MMGGATSRPNVVQNPQSKTKAATASAAGPVGPATGPAGPAVALLQNQSQVQARPAAVVNVNAKRNAAPPATANASQNGPTNNIVPHTPNAASVVVSSPDIPDEKIQQLHQERAALENHFIGKANATLNEQERQVEERFTHQKQVLIETTERERRVMLTRHQMELAEFQKKHEMAIQQLNQFKTNQICQLRVAIDQLTHFHSPLSALSTTAGSTAPNAPTSSLQTTSSVPSIQTPVVPQYAATNSTSQAVSFQTVDPDEVFQRDPQLEQWLWKNLGLTRREVTGSELTDLLQMCMDRNLSFPTKEFWLTVNYKTIEKHRNFLDAWEKQMHEQHQHQRQRHYKPAKTCTGGFRI